MMQQRVMIAGVNEDGLQALRSALHAAWNSEPVDVQRLTSNRLGDRYEVPKFIVCDLEHARSEEVDVVRDLLNKHPYIHVTLLTSNDIQAAAIQPLCRQGVETMRKLSDPQATADRLASHLAGNVRAAHPQPRGGSVVTPEKVQTLIRRLAPLSCHVLITGETGTGKARVVQLLHEQGPFADLPLVTINCAALEREALEAMWRESFSPTGANGEAGQKGGAGTVLLDHVDELPPPSQLVLLRLLDELYKGRAGGPTTGPQPPRLVSTASTPLDPLAAQECFRSDLLFRLRVATISLDPLRDRREDILRLAQHFVEELTPRLNPGVHSIAPATLQALSVYSWPGNVRELHHVIAHALIACDGGELQPSHLPQAVQPEVYASHETAGLGGAPWASLRQPQPPAEEESRSAASGAASPSGASEPLPADLKSAVRDYERMLIVRAIRECSGNRDEAARRLNISKATLYRKLDGFRPEV